MSEYYLADLKAEERAREQTGDASGDVKPDRAMKVTLLGDFLFPSSEPQGFDPYNNTQGAGTRDAWSMARKRR